MNKIYLLGAALATVVLASCSKDNDEPTVKYAVLTFESAPMLAGPTEAGENLYSVDYAYPTDPDFDGPRFTSYSDTETGITLGINLDQGQAWSTDNYEFSAGGIAPSRWHDMVTEGYLNQCSVYGEGGHAGSATFGIAFTATPAVMSFDEGVERTVESLWLANSTYTALWDTDAAEFLVVVEGFNAAGVSVGTKEIDMLGVTEWTALSTESLGKVNRLEFTVSCEDVMAPTYFCIDDVRVVL